MAAAGRVGWRFGAFELSPQRGLLWRDGVEVPLARKSFEVLVHLLRHRERVVPRREILAAVWPDVVVSDAAFASAIRDLRRALGDAGRAPRFVATVRGRGLRFVHPVEEVPDPAAAEPGGGWAEAAADLERALRALQALEAARGGEARADREAERAALRVALARARWAAGATAEARRLFLDTAHLAQRTRDGEVLGQAALGYVGRTDMTPGVNRRGVALLEEALRALPERDAQLRAELLARLGTELVLGSDSTRSEALAQAAVAMGERLGHAPTRAYALTALHFVRQRPDVEPADRRLLAERAVGLVHAPSDVLALALFQVATDRLELGEGEGFRAALARLGEVADALDQPFFAWIHALLQGTAALLDGRLDEVERRAHDALDRGRRIGSPNAEGAFAAQLFALRREQGRLGELRPVLEALGRRHGALPVYRAAHAAAVAAAGDRDVAREALAEVFKEGLSDFPRDRNWIATLGALGPAVAEAGGADEIRCLIAQLEPLRGRLLVAGHGATALGVASHQLARLREALGDAAGAERERACAREVYARLGARRWLAQLSGRDAS